MSRGGRRVEMSRRAFGDAGGRTLKLCGGARRKLARRGAAGGRAADTRRGSRRRQMRLFASRAKNLTDTRTRAGKRRNQHPEPPDATARHEKKHGERDEQKSDADGDGFDAAIERRRLLFLLATTRSDLCRSRLRSIDCSTRWPVNACGTRLMSAPHARQNFASSTFCAAHLGQNIIDVPPGRLVLCAAIVIRPTVCCFFVESLYAAARRRFAGARLRRARSRRRPRR